MRKICLDNPQPQQIMITEVERKALLPLPHGKDLGYDCEGKILQTGDMVEVVFVEELRKREKEWDFCSPGRQGKVQNYYMGWTLAVDFFGQQVGCTDINLRKL